MALRQYVNLVSSSQSHRVGHPIWGVRPLHRRVGSIQRCVNILPGAGIAEMEGLTIESQRQIGMSLKVARVPPLASKAIRI